MEVQDKPADLQVVENTVQKHPVCPSVRVISSKPAILGLLLISLHKGFYLKLGVNAPVHAMK